MALKARIPQFATVRTGCWTIWTLAWSHTFVLCSPKVIWRSSSSALCANQMNFLKMMYMTFTCSCRKWIILDSIHYTQYLLVGNCLELTTQTPTETYFHNVENPLLCLLSYHTLLNKQFTGSNFNFQFLFEVAKEIA